MKHSPNLTEPRDRTEAALDKLIAAARAASHALRSYQYGNVATDLAADTADAIDRAIADAETLRGAR